MIKVTEIQDFIIFIGEFQKLLFYLTYFSTTTIHICNIKSNCREIETTTYKLQNTKA